MDSTPEHRALLGLDVIGSARKAGHYLNVIPEVVDRILDSALLDSGIKRDEITRWENTGDGVILTLPSCHVGCLVELSRRIEVLAANHNRWRKPDIGLRIAIELGATRDEPGYYQPVISLCRMLDAAEFKKLLQRCIDEATDGAANSGLILSDHAYSTVFSGNYTDSVRRDDFVALPVAHKEFTQTAWVLIPGFDTRSIKGFIDSATTVLPPTPETDRFIRVHNETHGNVTGVQAGVVHGNIRFGSQR